MGSEVYTQKERFPESVTIASGDRLGGLPDVVHKREKMVVRVCYGRGCWQAVGLPGSVAQACTGVLSQAVRPAGKREQSPQNLPLHKLHNLACSISRY